MICNGTVKFQSMCLQDEIEPNHLQQDIDTPIDVPGIRTVAPKAFRMRLNNKEQKLEPNNEVSKSVKNHGVVSSKINGGSRNCGGEKPEPDTKQVKME